MPGASRARSANGTSAAPLAVTVRPERAAEVAAVADAVQRAYAGVAHSDKREAAALAPLSMVPEHQGRGVGTRLVRAAHGRARRLG